MNTQSVFIAWRDLPRHGEIREIRGNVPSRRRRSLSLAFPDDNIRDDDSRIALDEIRASIISGSAA